jgi:Protein of unknown function (DUF4239)
MLWLYQLPNSLLCFVVVGAYVLVALLGVAVTRRRMALYGGAMNELSLQIGANVGVIYAVLLAMIAVATWESFNTVATYVAREAASVGDIYREAGAYPAPKREEVRHHLKDYLDAVVNVEWPEQKAGLQAHGAGGPLSHLVEEITHFEPETEGQKILQGAVLNELASFLDYRRMRRQALDVGLVPEMWFVVVAGGLLTLSLTWLFWTPHTWIHAVAVAALACMIGLVTFLILAMDYPLIGQTTVSPQAYVRALEAMRTSD